jgi:transposase
MMGRQRRDQGRLFYEFRLEDRIPENHLLRRMNVFVTVALADLHKELEPHYSDIGRPSIDPELMIRMLIVGYCYGIRSERKLTQEVELHLAYRWFCKLDLDDKVPHHSTFSENRLGRFRESDLLRHIFERVVWTAMAMGLVKGEGFAVDASVLEANASRYHGRAPDELDWTASSARHERWPSILLRSMRPLSPIRIARRRRSSRRPILHRPGRPRPTSACSSATGSTI